MSTPSNRSGIPTLPVVALLALILFLGFALGPRAFEFRAWPEPSRPAAVEEIVARSPEVAVEVPVAGVKTKRGDALAVRGRNPRRPASVRGGRLGARGSAAAGQRARGRSRGASKGTRAPSAPQVVIEEPAPQPEAPVPAPEQPAQLAGELPDEQVLRPEAEELLPEQTPEPLRSYDAEPDESPDLERGYSRDRAHHRARCAEKR